MQEVLALRETGLRLASKWLWWGNAEPPANRSAIQLRPSETGAWFLKVPDAVGVIAIGALQIIVQPKIPLPHFLYLLSLSGRFPQLDLQRVRLAPNDSLWSLVAAWFVSSMEHLLRRELVRDYLPAREELRMARGRIAAVQTANAFYAGRLGLHCAFDEFGFDSPLNRVLKAAAREISSSAALPWGIRRRAIAALTRMSEVGELQADDLRVRLDRRTAHYADPWALALHVLQATGRTVAHGGEKAWGFLIRTPEMIEDGLRAILIKSLGEERVQKKGIQLAGTSLTINPDLLFDKGRAVADVKYKLSSGEWHRPDLYQVIAFAEAFRAPAAALLRFRSPGIPEMTELAVGDKLITEITWHADDRLEPGEAAHQFAAATGAWLESLRQIA
jgi:5-methylcytosine-specific restriction endonuclease McrBC regulatory subunit McrC